jgi:hypothetical protein
MEFQRDKIIQKIQEYSGVWGEDKLFFKLKDGQIKRVTRYEWDRYRLGMNYP